MADFSFITSRLATGAALLNQSDLQALVNAGISHVVDGREEFDDAQLFMSHPDISYLFNGVPDDGQPKPTSWFKKSLDFALPALMKPKCKVLCHCAAGHNRGPSLAFVIMLALGWEYEDALALMHKMRPATIGGIVYAADAKKAIMELGYF